MSEFRNLMQKIADVLEARTIIFDESRLHKQLAARWSGRGNPYNPMFSIVNRDGLKCVWSRNKIRHKKRSTEKEFARISNSKCEEGLTGEEWDSITLKVMRGLGMKIVHSQSPNTDQG